VLWTFQNITKLTEGGRTMFQIVMGLNWGRQEKDLTQFQVSIAHPDHHNQKTKQIAGDTRVYVPKYAKTLQCKQPML
jgi:hypothetical protein